MSRSSVSPQRFLSRSGFRPNQGAAREVHQPLGGQDSRAAERSRVSGARSPRGRRRGAGTLEFRGCLWKPSASGLPGPPAAGAPETRSTPGPPRNKVTAALGARAWRGECGQDPRGPLVTALRVSLLSPSPGKKLLLPNEHCWTSVKVRAAAVLGAWGCLTQEFLVRGSSASDPGGMRGRVPATTPSAAGLRGIPGEVPADFGSQLVAPFLRNRSNLCGHKLSQDARLAQSDLL